MLPRPNTLRVAIVFASRGRSRGPCAAAPGPLQARIESRAPSRPHPPLGPGKDRPFGVCGRGLPGATIGTGLGRACHFFPLQGTAARLSYWLLRPGPPFALMHRSAWKGSSPKFACSIPYKPDPKGGFSLHGTTISKVVDTTCGSCGWICAKMDARVCLIRHHGHDLLGTKHPHR